MEKEYGHPNYCIQDKASELFEMQCEVLEQLGIREGVCPIRPPNPSCGKQADCPNYSFTVSELVGMQCAVTDRFGVREAV